MAAQGAAAAVAEVEQAILICLGGAADAELRVRGRTGGRPACAAACLGLLPAPWGPGGGRAADSPPSPPLPRNAPPRT